MAEIYLARVAGAEGFSKLVVVKRLLDKLAGDPEFVQMFLDEARINARLSHANIVQVLELGSEDGQYFMAMEYISGLSVAQVGRLATQRLGEVPQGVACGIVAQACAGLHRAHETKLPDGSNMGIIHRDVSPQNLLLTYEGYVKVVDFGIAKAEGRATQTRAGLVKGKFAYMSPEQCLGEDIDRRTDIFALGIVLFELCTSRRLFKRNSTYETYDAIVRCDVPPPSQVSPAVTKQVEAVIMKALAKRKEDRFVNAEAMQEALELAMRRSAHRGSPLDLSRFLEQNFATEIHEQEQLLRRVESGELAQPEHREEMEKSQIAKNYADQQDDDGGASTVIQERAPASSAPPPPPTVPAVPSGPIKVSLPGPLKISAPAALPQDQLEMIPHRPMSMAMPIISTDPPVLQKRSPATPMPGPLPPPAGGTPQPLPAPTASGGFPAGASAEVVAPPQTASASYPPVPPPMTKTPTPLPAPGLRNTGDRPIPARMSPPQPQLPAAFVPVQPLPSGPQIPQAHQGQQGPQSPQSPLTQIVNMPLPYLVAAWAATALLGAALSWAIF